MWQARRGSCGLLPAEGGHIPLRHDDAGEAPPPPARRGARGARATLRVALLLALVVGLNAAVPAGAAGLEFVVDDTRDLRDARVGDGACDTTPGTCTLRAAIQETNALPGADTVIVPAGTYALEIPPLNQNLADNGDLDITDSLEIAGAGAGATIVDGGTPQAGAPPRVHGLDRLFEVLADGGAVTFSGLKFSDGYAAEYGAAIMNNSTATVTVAAATLMGNVADKAGGAIDNHLGGAVHLRDSTLLNNFAFESGSALNNNRDGTLTVTNSTISSNSAADIGLDESVLGAGAIANNAELDARGTIAVTASQIGDNTAGGSRSGAAISNDGAGTVTVEQTTFSKNRAKVDGGAIFNGAGDVTVTGSTFSENAGQNGGAIFNSAKDGRMTVSDSTFSLNSAAARGGAIANSGTGSLTVIDSTFSKNRTEGWGGAVANDDKGSVAIVNSAFRENSGLNGGGFGNEGDGLVTVENSTFTKNSAFVTSVLASGEGGGMHSNSSGDVVVTGGAFVENTARDGGGLGNEGGGQLRITGTRFSANKAEEKGGGILIQSGTIRMLDIDVVGNVADGATEAGGGIAYEGDKLVSVGEAAAIENSRIRNNTAKGQGGGIDSRGDGPLDIVTTSITGNTAGMGGGVHHVGDAPLDINRSILSGNFAESGGGLFTDGDGETTVENATVSSNRAGQFGGGLLVSSRLRLRSTTVAGNNAASGGGINNGGGDLVGDGTVFLLNTIVANNPSGGNCQGTITSLGGNIDSGDSCALRELSDQPGTDPRLGPLADNGGATQTHALLAGSPAQEKAVCTEVDPCPPVDQRGVARPVFESSDVGAYESESPVGGGGGEQPCSGRSERPVVSDFDSWINENVPGANFGTDSILKVKSLQGVNQRALVHFTLPAVPPGCKLVGATLRLFSSAATEGRTLEALRVASDWSEFGVTWGDQPETGGAAAATQSERDFREWDVLEQTREMYDSGDHGFLIRDAAENEGGEQSFHSTEKGTDRPPELVLVFDDPNAPPPSVVCPTTPQSLAADSDSWVSEGSPLNNFGTDSTLKVKSQLGYNARALVRFPLPPLPAGCTSIASATLRLDAQSGAPDRSLETLRVASRWDETGVTWSNQPRTTGPAASIPSGEGTLEWPVTAQVLDMYVSENHGLLIRDAEENGVGHEQTFNGRLKLNDGPPELVLVFDDSMPETTIDSVPPRFSREPEATFRFFSDRPDATFECSLDGAAFQACSSPRALLGLAEGPHVFEVRSTRPVRAVDPTPARYEWTIDVTAPESVIDGKPADPTNKASATFTFAAVDNLDQRSHLRIQCRLDDSAAGWADCSSPRTYEELAEGPHTFEVRAIDRAGNIGTPAAHTWTVDLTAPETTLGERPADPTKSTSARFTFAADEDARFECSRDGIVYSSCESPAVYPDLADGVHSFDVRAVDPAGNTDGSPAPHSWTVDTRAPETSIDAGPDEVTQSTSAEFSFSADEPDALLACSLDGAPLSECASPREYTGLGEGDHSFRVTATDRAGNVGTAATYAWTIDRTAPETTIGDRPADPTNSVSVALSFSADEAATFECALNGSLFTPCESPKEYADIPASSYTFEVRATDPAGNTGTPVSYSWTVDRTAPVTTIADRPPDPTNATSVAFSFTADEAANFECALNGSLFTACESPKEYPDLPEGSYVFEVRATDPAGNTGIPASYSWTVDRTAPETTIGDHPADPTNSKQARFSFSSDERASLECALDGSSFAACESPAVYEDLAEGVHTFQARATDPAGNREETAASYSWTIDTTAPETTIDERPPDPANSSSATLWFSADEAGASLECALDEAAFAPCLSPAVHSDLAEGRHTFQVRATDRAGNPDTTAASYSWTVDTTAPETTLGERPDDPTNGSSATFTFTADDASASFECARDQTGFEACDSPALYADLAEGVHSFQVRAKDGAGNADPTPASYTWTIDQTSPETTIESQPADPTNSNAATFTFSAGEDASFECARDRAAFAPCESPVEYAGLSDGRHTFEVRAVDRAGNREAAPAAYAWTVDLTAPETTIGERPADPTNSTSARFTFAADEDARFECSRDGIVYTPCDSPAVYSDLADGVHRFDVRAVDPAGNTDQSPAHHSWTVDTRAPETSIHAGPDEVTQSTSAQFSFTADEPDAALACSLDGAPFSACVSPHEYTGLGEGHHTFRVQATDRAGNIDQTPASYSWTVDRTAPETSIGDRPADPTNAGSAILSFSANEPVTFACALDGGAFAACESPALYENLPEGRHSFQVQAVDPAGNADLTPASYSWTVDQTPPDTTIDLAPPAETASTTASFEFSAEPGASFECALDTAAFSSCQSPRQYTGLSLGPHEFRVRATDRAGNRDDSAAAYRWTVTPPPDTVAPETSIELRPADPTNSTSATFTFSASEPASFACSLDDAPFTPCDSSKEYTGLAAGTHSFQVQATDRAGNVDSSPARYSWTIDRTPPETAIGERPADPTNSTSARFTFSADEYTSFECALGDASFAACASPAVYADLAEGTYTFQVRATDRAGNVDLTPATHRWTVDRTAPETTIVSTPEPETTERTARFEFSAELGATFACALDGGAFAACTSPRQYTGLSGGAHQFRVRATDRAGNADGTPATHSWTISTPVDCGAGTTAAASADAWIDQNSPTANKGGDSILKVQSKGPRDNFRAFVRFAIPTSVPQGCVVASATLRLYAASSRTGRTLHALRVSSPWTEGQVAWGNQPQTTGSAAATASGLGYREWNVTSQVQAIYETGANHGFLIRDAAEDADAEQQFHSREKGESPPQLVIRFAPAPAG